MTEFYWSDFGKTDEHLVRMIWPYLNLPEVFRLYTTSDDFIEKFIREEDWTLIAKHRIFLTYSFIEKHADKLNWDDISQYQHLDDEFILKHRDRLNMSLISEFQSLKTDTIRELRDVLDWKKLIKHQRLTDDFYADDTLKWKALFSVLSQD